MNKKQICNEKLIIQHDLAPEQIRVIGWIEIQLSLHKRKENVVQWLNDLNLSFDLNKRLLDLSMAEWIGLQYLAASLRDHCIIWDPYDRYKTEEIMAINRILRKTWNQKKGQIFAADKRILYSRDSSMSSIKISMTCSCFHAEKYQQLADVHQEGNHLISYFSDRKKAVRFLIKCLNQEEIHYLELRECDEKTGI